jgi:hypothetical protein
MYIIKDKKMDSLAEVDKKYNKKLQEALKNENHNDLINLMFELKILRSSFKKQRKMSKIF